MLEKLFIKKLVAYFRTASPADKWIDTDSYLHKYADVDYYSGIRNLIEDFFNNKNLCKIVGIVNYFPLITKGVITNLWEYNCYVSKDRKLIINNLVTDYSCKHNGFLKEKGIKHSITILGEDEEKINDLCTSFKSEFEEHFPNLWEEEETKESQVVKIPRNEEILNFLYSSAYR